MSRSTTRPAGIRLAGTLTLPPGKGPFPAVALITGSGRQNRDDAIFGHKPFLVLSDYLTRKGIAVLRDDDRGEGDSQGDYDAATAQRSLLGRRSRLRVSQDEARG